MLGLLLRLLFLNARAQQLPDTTATDVSSFVAVAIVEATPHVSAELLVSLAWAESRFQSDARPACGVMQVFPRHINRPSSDCQLYRQDLTAAVRAGVAEIEMMLADRRVHGDLRRALMYRACGNAFFTGECNKAGWVNAVLARQRILSAKTSTSASS